jgi:cytochrome o ubiquinol oxidase subunit 2
MSTKIKLRAVIVVGLGILLATGLYLSTLNIPVLQPAGVIGEKQRNLFYFSLLLSAVVVVPVFAMLLAFSLKYREGNKGAKYNPHFNNSKKLESVWWGVPFAIIVVLSIITWNSSHDLDPFKSISAANQPMHIQVIALQWKWLFIYPEQNIASVNFVQFPKDTPIDFEITSDAPMNSFWIPKLGGQIYAMPGMSTHLNLMANKSDDFDGKSANISGEGFAKMTFTARASSPSEFTQWEERISKANNPLTTQSYAQLAKPAISDHAIYYSSAEPNIYNAVVNKYMGHMHQNIEHKDGMEM